MKHLTLTLLILVFAFHLGGTAFAQENTPKDNQLELKELIDLTRQHSEFSRDTLTHLPTSDQSHWDYLEKIKPFMNETEKSFDSFRVFLDTEVLGALKEDILGYNAQVNDKVSSRDQIEQSLPGLYNRIQATVSRIQLRYQDQIKALYASLWILPNQTFTAKDEFSPFTTLNGRSILLQNPDALPVEQNIFQNWIIPILAKGCKSFTCVTYTQSDYAKFVEHVSNVADQDFPIKLADGKSFILKAPRLYISKMTSLIRTTTYPAWVNNLPTFPGVKP